MSELIVKQDNLPQQQTVDFLRVISDAARDPNVNVEKMHGLLDVQERMMNKQAEIEFNAAFAEMQSEIPRITKDGSIKISGKVQSTYATYDQIDASIRPLLVKYGFGLRFNSEIVPDGKSVIITGTLSHRSGHSITDRIPLGFETSGSKNNVQAVGSTISYGKRYLVSMLLNLVFEGEDDDGQKAGYKPITAQQAQILKDLIRETGTDTKKLLATMVSGANSIDEIADRDFERVRNSLVAKKNKVTEQ